VLWRRSQELKATPAPHVERAEPADHSQAADRRSLYGFTVIPDRRTRDLGAPPSEKPKRGKGEC
jgi:hypothetical protein